MNAKPFDCVVLTKDRRDVHEAIVELRTRDVSYHDIAEALDYFWGIRLTASQVRRRARFLGVPRDEARVRELAA